MKSTNISHWYWQERTDYLFVIMFSVAAIYHLIGFFIRINDASEHRHLLFALIDLYCVYGFYDRHRVFYLFFTTLTLHQLFTHTMYLFTMWQVEQQIQWVSICVIILMPLGLVKLVIEYFTD
jgi:hypothetical protein